MIWVNLVDRVVSVSHALILSFLRQCVQIYQGGYRFASFRFIDECFSPAVLLRTIG